MYTPLLALFMMQIGPNPTTGQIEDHSAMVQDRPPREQDQPEVELQQADPASLIGADDNGWLNTCLGLVETDPARAHVQAQLRRDQTEGGNRVVANYCLGLAASAIGLWSDAEIAFAAARDEADANEPALRARFGIMAGNAAAADGQSARAVSILDQARAVAEQAGANRLGAFAAMDAARIHVSEGRDADAENALADARRLDAKSAEAWLLSATLSRRMEMLEAAQDQIEQARILAPGNADVELEAGVIAVLGGRDDHARESWNTVIALDEASPQAEAARSYLAQLSESERTP